MRVPFTSPHHSLPAGAPTVPRSRVPPQCCLSPRLSLGLIPHTAWHFWISEPLRLPQVPSDAPLLPYPLWVPGCSAHPSRVSGTRVPMHSSNNLRALQMHCGLTSNRAPRAMAAHVLLLPQNTPIVLKRAAGAAGPGASKNPHLTFSFVFFPFFPVFLVFQVSATAIPQHTNLPAPARGGGSGAWAPLGAGG